MKSLVVLLLCAQLAAPASRPLPSRPPAQLTGHESGLEQPDYGVVEVRIRFYAQRSDGDAVAEQVFPGVELLRGRFSASVEAVPHHRRFLFVEVGLRPSGRQSLLGALEPGRSYVVSAWVRIAGRTEEPEITMVSFRQEFQAHALDAHWNSHRSVVL